MKRYITTILFSFFCAIGFLQAQQDHQRIKVYADNEDLTTIQQMGIDISHCNVKSGEYLISDFSPYEVDKIKESGLSYQVLFKNASEYYNLQRNPVLQRSREGEQVSCNESAKFAIPSNFELGSMGGFHRYQEILDHLDNMSNSYPELINNKTAIGSFLTYEERPIYSLVLTGPNDGPKKQILYTALHHAREPMSVSNVIFFMYYLLENYESDPSVQYLVDNNEIHFIPIINPDGYLYNESLYTYNDVLDIHQFGFWRKNKRDNDGEEPFSNNFDGVDLNRNYSMLWALNDVGSSFAPTSNNYRGPAPFSEAETQAIKFYVENNDFKVAVNAHSYQNILIGPSDTILRTSPDSAHVCGILELCTSENQHLPGSPEEVLSYNVNGISDDWLVGDTISKDVVIGITPEIGHSVDGFYPAQDRIIELSRQMVGSNLFAMKAMGSFAVNIEKEVIEVNAIQGHIPVKIKQYGLESGAFNVSMLSLNDKLVFPETIETTVLTIGEILSDSLAFSFIEMPDYAEVMQVVLQIDNGLFIENDTMEFTVKIEEDNSNIVNYENDFTATSSFESNFWGLTTSAFYSPPSCLTDSPDTTYGNNRNWLVNLTEEFDLTNAKYAELSYWAKWDIESRYDYVQVLITNVDNGSMTSLCGQLTNINGSAGPGEPVYDGYQTEWVQDKLFLNDFLGQKIQVSFLLTSDEGAVRDGFYIDDLKVEIVDEDYVLSVEDNLANMEESFAIVSVLPNPSSSYVQILTDLPNKSALKVVDQVGRLVFEREMENGRTTADINVNEWPDGIYFIYLENEIDGHSAAFKFLKH